MRSPQVTRVFGPDVATQVQAESPIVPTSEVLEGVRIALLDSSHESGV
jgi:hypothetical protein